VDLAGAVRGKDHDRNVLGADGADLGNGHLEVGEQLQQECLQLLIGAIDLIDQQDGSLGMGGIDRLQQWPLEQELFGKEIVAHALPALAPGRLHRAQKQHLARVIPFVDGGGRVETLVALQADQRRFQQVSQDLGDFRLADARLAFQEERLAEFEGQEEGGGQATFRDIALGVEAAFQFIDTRELVTGGRGGLLGYRSAQSGFHPWE
jgi:hypothetical protein